MKKCLNRVKKVSRIPGLGLILFSQKQLFMEKPNFYAVAVVTLDGKIARNSSHLTDWSSKEDKEFLHKKMDEADVIILGNNTYKLAKDKLIERKRNCIVFTNSVEKTAKENELLLYVNPNNVDIVELMNEHSHKKICVLGGSKTYSYFLEKDLLDELFITIEPIVFGSGINLFEKEIPEKKFNLVSMEKLNGKGTVLLSYKK